jgi:hypothetical protein
MSMRCYGFIFNEPLGHSQNMIGNHFLSQLAHEPRSLAINVDDCRCVANLDYLLIRLEEKKEEETKAPRLVIPPKGSVLPRIHQN